MLLAAAIKNGDRVAARYADHTGGQRLGMSRGKLSKWAGHGYRQHSTTSVHLRASSARSAVLFSIEKNPLPLV